MVNLSGRSKDGEYIEVLSDSIEKRFRSKLIEKQQEYVKRHKPFCYRCAKIDFTNKLNREIAESKVAAETTKEVDFQLEKLMPKDLDEYGNTERFTLLKEEEVHTERLEAGIKIPHLVAVRQNFVCKIRNCGHAVEVPIRIWEKRTGKTWKNLVEEEEDRLIEEERKKKSSVKEATVNKTGM